MFFDKLRLLATVYSRTHAVQGAIRQPFNFPAIAHSVRTYARFVDDDDDDMLTTKTRVARREPKKSPFARYNDNDDDDDDFGQRKSRGTSSFGGQKTRYGGFGQKSSGYGAQRFNSAPRFNNNNNYNNNARPQFERSQSRSEKFNSGLQKLQPIEFDHSQLGEIKKDFYQPSELTKNRSDEEVREFRRKHDISVPGDAPKPIFTFDELENLPPKLATEITKQNFIECTPIQAQGMPIALSGKNMVGIAQTG